MLRSRIIFLTGIFLSLLLVLTAKGQGSATRSLPVTVHGQIRYARGGAPVENVLVRLERFSGGMEGEALTDRTGKFQFSGMPPAVYLLKIHLPGFRDEQRQVDLQSAPTDYVLFQLLPEKTEESGPRIQSKRLLDAKVPPQAQRDFEKAEEIYLGNRKDRLRESVRYLEMGISIYPAFFEAQLQLGTIYLTLGELDKAEQSLVRACEINPLSAPALFGLGEVQLQRKLYAEAEKSLRDGLKIDDRSWQGHFILGRLYWNKGDLIKAGRQIALSLQLNPNFADAHLLGANILLRAGKREDALGEFEEYLRLAPKGEYSAQVRETERQIKTALKEKQ